jgi:hypothetical protein
MAPRLPTRIELTEPTIGDRLPEYWVERILHSYAHENSLMRTLRKPLGFFRVNGGVYFE